MREHEKKRIKRHLLGAARCVSDFEKLGNIGEGTYGTVFKARDKASRRGEVVALKKLRMHNENDGFPLTSLREIAILQSLKQHTNLVRLNEVVVGYKKDSVFLNFEYCEGDMAVLLDYMSRNRHRGV